MMKKQIAFINSELQQIYVRGIDSIHMANALMELERVFNELPDDPVEETTGEKKDASNKKQNAK